MINISVLPYRISNQAILDLEVKDHIRRMKIQHPELNILPRPVFGFGISFDKDNRLLISTTR